MICFMVVVPVVVTSQRPIALVGIFPHGRGPFKVGVVPNEGEQSIIGDVEGAEFGRFPFLFLLFLGALLTLALASFLFGLAIYGSFAALGSYHHCLFGGPDIILQSGVFICPPIQFFHGCGWIKGKGLEERGSRPKASSKVL